MKVQSSNSTSAAAANAVAVTAAAPILLQTEVTKTDGEDVNILIKKSSPQPNIIVDQHSVGLTGGGKIVGRLPARHVSL